MGFFVPVKPPFSLLLLLIEGIGYLLASIKRAYENEESAPSNYEAEGACRFVAFVI